MICVLLAFLLLPGNPRAGRGFNAHATTFVFSISRLVRIMPA